MATLSAIRDAIASTLDAAIPTLHCYDTVPDVANLPAVVVIPATTDFVAAMGRGTDTHTLNLYVLAAYMNADLGQAALDELVAGSGAKSIRQVIWNNRSLGLVQTDAHISGMSGYGGNFNLAQVEHVGAILTAIVHSSGTA